MQLRRILLRIMLWSLGLAAIAGVGAMLLAKGDTVWRVVGTASMTAGIAGMMLWASRLIDRPVARLAGLLTMGVLLIDFLLGLALIWHQYGSWRLEERLYMTLLQVSVTGFPAAALLRLRSHQSGRLAGLVGIVVFGMVLVVAQIPTWLAMDYHVENHLYETAAALGWLVLPALGCLFAPSLRDRRWRWLGVLAAIASLSIALVGIWRDLHQRPDALVMAIGIAVAIGYANLALRIPFKSNQQWLAWGAIAAVGATALLADIVTIRQKDFDDLYSRMCGAAGIVSACGTLALIIVALLNRKLRDDNQPTDFTDIVLFCPRCNRKHKMPFGDGHCNGCGLRISVRVEEPRCVNCGYLLYMLTSDRCPECGTPTNATMPAPDQSLPRASADDDNRSCAGIAP